MKTTLQENCFDMRNMAWLNDIVNSSHLVLLSMLAKLIHQRLTVRAALLVIMMVFSSTAVPAAGAVPPDSSPAASSDATVSQPATIETVQLATGSNPPMQVSPTAVERDGADATLQSGGLYWSGQEIAVAVPESVTDADTVEIRQYSSEYRRAGSLVREFDLGIDRSIEIPTTGLNGKYLLVPAGTRSQAFQVSSDGVATNLVDPRDTLFEVAEQSLRIEWGQDQITTGDDGDDDVGLDIRSNRARYNLKVSADGLDYDDLESLFRSGGAANNPDPYTNRQPFAIDGVVHDGYADDDELVIRGLRDDSLIADFTQIDAGRYNLTFEVTDTGVTSRTPVGDEEMNENSPEVKPDPAFFNLTDFDPASTTVAPNNPLTVSAMVTNTGGTAATQTVEFRIDKDPVASEEVSLDPDESKTVSFDIETPDESGRYVHSVHTTDTSVTGELTVEPSESESEPGSEPESDPEPEAETDDGTPGFGGIVALAALIAAALLVIRRRP